MAGPLFPSTSGGAAGSLVRGNDFYQNAPAPYSNTRRGQDTIHVSPGHIKVTRPAAGKPLPPELVLSLRFTPEQVGNYDWIETSEQHEGWRPEYGWHARRLHGLVLSAPKAEDVKEEGPQQQSWTFPASHQQKGHLVNVGDGYFVSVVGRYTESAIPSFAEMQAFPEIGTRVALIHKRNLSSPYINTVTRQIDPYGQSLWFHKPPDGSDRGYGDDPSRLKDTFGANYFLEEARYLVQREWSNVSAGRGHVVSVVPLGWMDKEHRYAFAVFGESLWGQPVCFVYCTGTRALVRGSIAQPPIIAAPPATASTAREWSQRWHSSGWCPKMTALGKGKMATIMMPLAIHPDPENPSRGNTYSHIRQAGDAPMLVYSLDYGRTWNRRVLTELEAVIAKPVQPSERVPNGGFYYPELRFELQPTDEHGNFMLLIAALNDRPSGDVASTAYDEIYNGYLSRGAEAPAWWRWWYSGDTERMSYATLFRGNINFPGLNHLTQLDSYKLRFGHYVYEQYYERSDETLPPGTYRYNIIMNAGLGTCTPMMQPVAENTVALLVRTMEVTITPGWDINAQSYERESYKVIDTFVLQVWGSTVRRFDLPPEFVSYSDVAAYGAKVYPEYPSLRAVAPGLDYLSWCVIAPERRNRCARLAVMVQNIDRAALYVTNDRINPWALKRLRTLQPEPVLHHTVAESGWDKGNTSAPSGLAYLGDAGSEQYPEHLMPALPNLFK